MSMWNLQVYSSSSCTVELLITNDSKIMFSLSGQLTCTCMQTITATYSACPRNWYNRLIVLDWVSIPHTEESCFIHPGVMRGDDDQDHVNWWWSCCTQSIKG
jgi:hypothetical protein